MKPIQSEGKTKKAINMKTAPRNVDIIKKTMTLSSLRFGHIILAPFEMTLKNQSDLTVQTPLSFPFTAVKIRNRLHPRPCAGTDAKPM